MNRTEQSGIEKYPFLSPHKVSLREILFPACIALVASTITYFLWRLDSKITGENRLIENCQVSLLGLASLIHFIKSRGILDSPLAKICERVLGLLCLSLIVREVDINKLGDSSIWPGIERAIRVIVVAAWLPLAASVYRNLPLLWNDKARILMSSCAWLTGAGVIFYMLSFFFDKSLVPISASPSLLCEQLLQLTATIFYFSGALHSCGYSSEGESLGITSVR